jgi:hypothetical protein
MSLEQQYNLSHTPRLLIHRSDLSDMVRLAIRDWLCGRYVVDYEPADSWWINLAHIDGDSHVQVIIRRTDCAVYIDGDCSIVALDDAAMFHKLMALLDSTTKFYDGTTIVPCLDDLIVD